jgi:hypothetical protein
MGRRRLVLWLGVLVVVATTGYGVVQRLIPERPISRDAYDRISKGMTQVEVEAILSGPPRPYFIDNDYVEETVIAPLPGFCPGAQEDVKYDRLWGGSRLGIEVYFDDDGRVVEKRLLAVYRKGDWLHQLRRWLGL